MGITVDSKENKNTEELPVKEHGCSKVKKLYLAESESDDSLPRTILKLDPKKTTCNTPVLVINDSEDKYVNLHGKSSKSK